MAEINAFKEKSISKESLRKKKEAKKINKKFSNKVKSKNQTVKRFKKSAVKTSISNELKNTADLNSDSAIEEFECEANESEEQNSCNEQQQEANDASEPEHNDDNDVSSSVRTRRKKFKKDPLKEARTIFVGNVPISMTAKELKKTFKNFGEIESLRFRNVTPSKPTIAPKVATIMKGQMKHEHRNSSNAYIVYKEKEACEKAMSMNGQIIDGHHLRVDISTEVSYKPSLTAFVGNLPGKVTEEDLWNFFGEESNIEAIRIIRDRTTGLGKGIAFVMFASKDDVALALEKRDLELKGRKLRISRFQSKTGAKVKGERYATNRSNFRRKSQIESNSALLTNKAAKPKFKKLRKMRKILAKKQQIAEVLNK